MKFRKLFITLRGSPLIDYRQYRQLDSLGGVFSFSGGIESITDAHTLWVRGRDCTIPVSLEKTQCWLLPLHEGATLPEPPEKVRWDRVSTLTEGVKVFIGGRIKTQNNRLSFISTKEEPLMVIFYNCPDNELTSTIIKASRDRNEYWNSFSSFSLVLGALSLISIAASYLNRPAYRITVISALVAAFIPILPVMPPGLLFTLIYRRMTWQARNLRAKADLVKIGINHESTSGSITVKAYTIEAAAWFFLLTGILVNVVFIFLILRLLGAF